MNEMFQLRNRNLDTLVFISNPNRRQNFCVGDKNSCHELLNLIALNLADNLLDFTLHFIQIPLRNLAQNFLKLPKLAFRTRLFLRRKIQTSHKKTVKGRNQKNTQLLRVLAFCLALYRGPCGVKTIHRLCLVRV